MIEQTLSIIKPDAVQNSVVGKIIDRFESNGLKIAAIKKMQLSKEVASEFYDIHKERPFFNDLVEFMTSGPVVVMVLNGENAVKKNRELMGDTDPKKAQKGTIRADFAQSIDANAVHGSDSVENAEREIQFFFSQIDICWFYYIKVKIEFKKISNEVKKFSLNLNDNFQNIVFSGSIYRIDKKLFKLDSTINGEMNLICDKTGDEYTEPVDIQVSLLLSDGIWHSDKHSNDDNFDVLEFLDGYVDLDFILHSELESIKLDYHIKHIDI